jgi:pyrroline-5-carboxylate reductase
MIKFDLISGIMKRIGIIGCGNLGLSILKGIVATNDNAQIIVSKRNTSSLTGLFPEDQVKITSDNGVVIEESEILIIALKPYTILLFLQEYKNKLDSNRHTVVSAATGISTNEIHGIIGDRFGVYRVMPNTASSVQESVTAICSSNDPLNREVMIVELFEGIGTVIKINEDLMESATIMGACGVAYVLRFMRAMIQGGIEVGFDAKTATSIVSQTVKGAAELIIQNNSHPEEEIDKVTTPKGCTIVGLNEMEHAGFSSALIKGIVSSYQKIEQK